MPTTASSSPRIASPGAITGLMLSQVRRTVGGWLASALQKSLIRSVLRVAMMSS